MVTGVGLGGAKLLSSIAIGIVADDIEFAGDFRTDGIELVDLMATVLTTDSIRLVGSVLIDGAGFVSPMATGFAYDGVQLVETVPTDGVGLVGIMDTGATMDVIKFAGTVLTDGVGFVGIMASGVTTDGVPFVETVVANGAVAVDVWPVSAWRSTSVYAHKREGGREDGLRHIVIMPLCVPILKSKNAISRRSSFGFGNTTSDGHQPGVIFSNLATYARQSTNASCLLAYAQLGVKV